MTTIIGCCESDTNRTPLRLTHFAVQNVLEKHLIILYKLEPLELGGTSENVSTSIAYSMGHPNSLYTTVNCPSIA